MWFNDALATFIRIPYVSTWSTRIAIGDSKEGALGPVIASTSLREVRPSSASEVKGLLSDITTFGVFLVGTFFGWKECAFTVSSVKQIMLSYNRLRRTIKAVLLIRIRRPRSRERDKRSARASARPPIGACRVRSSRRRRGNRRTPSGGMRMLYLRTIRFRITSSSLISVMFRDLLCCEGGRQEAITTAVEGARTPGRLPTILPISKSPLLGFRCALVTPVDPAVTPTTCVGLITKSGWPMDVSITFIVPTLPSPST